ncbi:MFS transporter [Micromonospora antibiotica]|uniref:MFS transporter n=1 Tax=Micromonospora antibiotica TaxID=2807623 RepID=A0ABS3V6H2_9ACTN|nr:MFS transporter [Micromonospora antibiotica]MBO4161199.1 MFS transporter [Micromonospora antibiotica]
MTDLIAPSAGVRFAALRNPDCRPYLIGTGLAMMADNIEHVITYWVLWRTFHSPALAGFQVISHWLPFLLLSVAAGTLADRYDCRRVVQAAQGLFMAVSLAWGLLFLTGTLQIWHAAVLLVLHGCAGALWGPAEQLLLYDFSRPGELPSAVRLNATFRSLGQLCGPVVGSVLLLLGPSTGILLNVAFYLPLTLFLARTRFTGHRRAAQPPTTRTSPLSTILAVRGIRFSRTVTAMIVIAGLGSFFVGASLQSTMPEFAEDLGAGHSGAAYGVLLFATAAGAVLGGLLFEATGWVRPTVRAAVAATIAVGLCTLLFALTNSLVVAVAALAVSGLANLTAMSISQTVVQLHAPPDHRGLALGLYSTSAGGLRIGSGFTVGLAGAAIGLHWSLALSSAALIGGALVTAAYARSGHPADSGSAPR